MCDDFIFRIPDAAFHYEFRLVMLQRLGLVAHHMVTILGLAGLFALYNGCGPLAFHTYNWGIWVYWSIIAVVYSLVRINEVAA
jgi:hypothetical protein